VTIGQTVAKMTTFQFFKMAAAAILDFYSFQILTVSTICQESQTESSCQISWRSVKPLRDMAIFRVSKMAAGHHLGFVMRVFGQPAKGIWWSLLLCKIWLESMQEFR